MPSTMALAVGCQLLDVAAASVGPGDGDADVDVVGEPGGGRRRRYMVVSSQ
jgi:hypothetical protein